MLLAVLTAHRGDGSMRGLFRELALAFKASAGGAFCRRIYLHIHACMRTTRRQALTRNPAITHTATAGSSNSCCCAHIGKRRWQAPWQVLLLRFCQDCYGCFCLTAMHTAHNCVCAAMHLVLCQEHDCYPGLLRPVGFFPTIGRIAASTAAGLGRRMGVQLVCFLCSVVVEGRSMLPAAAATPQGAAAIICCVLVLQRRCRFAAVRVLGGLRVQDQVEGRGRAVVVVEGVLRG